MKERMSPLRRQRLLLALCCAVVMLASVYLAYSVYRQPVCLEIYVNNNSRALEICLVTTDSAGNAAEPVYATIPAHEHTNLRRVSVPIPPDTQSVTLTFPADRRKYIELCDMTLTKGRRIIACLFPSDIQSTFTQLDGIAMLDASANNLRLQIYGNQGSMRSDSFGAVTGEASATRDWSGALFPLVLGAGVCVLLWFYGETLWNRRRNLLALSAQPTAIKVELAIILALMVTLTITTSFGSHPDEFVHLRAVDWYRTNVLPPPLTDMYFRNSLSNYGGSRLFNTDFYYPLAGYITRFLPNPTQHSWQYARWLNVALFAFTVLYLARKRKTRPLAWVMLAVPQIWYVFSYISPDAMSFAFCMILAGQMLNPESWLQQWIQGGLSWKKVYKALPSAFMLASLWLGKQNYLVFLLFFFILCLEKLLVAPKDTKKAMFVRMLALAGGVFAILGAKLGVPMAMGRAATDAYALHLQENYAVRSLRPSLQIDNPELSGLLFRAKGFSLQTMIQISQWWSMSFRSFVGHFGYMALPMRPIFYKIFGGSGVLLLLWASVRAFWKDTTDRTKWVAYAAALLCTLLVIGASLWFSWTVDVQPQGRYLFPAFAMWGYVVARCLPGEASRTSKAVRIAQPLLMLAGAVGFIVFAIGQMAGI